MYAICFFTGPEDEEFNGTGGMDASGNRRFWRIQRRNNLKELVATVGKQTMLSTLHKSATDSDVILATAMSSIPLKELGGNQNDIIVEVGQQMYLNKDDEHHEEHQCIVCKNRNKITWNQISCYAQTTIGVLVYKRSLVEVQKPQENQVLQSQSTTIHDTRNRPTTLSTLSIAPTPDSRLDTLRLESESAEKDSTKALKSSTESQQIPATTELAVAAVGQSTKANK